MSSRVQKGGTLFRPVVKSRAKTASSSLSRQPSASVEQLRTESEQDILVAENPQPLQTDTQNDAQSVPLSSQPLQEVETTKSLSRSSVVPEERFATPRPPVLPPAVGGSIIGISQRPVRSTPIVVPARNRGPRSSTQDLPIAGSSNAAANSGESAPKTLTPMSSAPTEQRDSSVAEPRNEPESSMESTASAEPTEPSSTTPIDASISPEENPRASKRRKPQNEGSKKQRRRKSVPKEGDDTAEDENTVPKRPRSRASSSTPRPRRKAPSPPPYDPDADPGEDIDPTTVTMASLCSDTGQGRVSRKAAEILSNHTAWKIKNREKRARMKAMMEAKKYGREEEEADLEAESAAQENNSPLDQGSSTAQKTAAITDDTGHGFDYSEDLTTSRFNVQVRIGPNGETIIDENSLVVDRVEDDGTENYTHVVESDHSKFVNSGTYGKRYRGSRWSAEETELFYDALAQYGENYELIAYVLPGRDRKSCKNKFKVEDKKNHARINHCLDNSIPVDMTTLSRMTGKDFSGPVPEIRAPTPLPLVTPNEETTEKTDEPSRPSVKRRSRSKSHGVDSGLIVVGDAENFES